MAGFQSLSNILQFGFYADYFTDRLCRIYSCLVFVILGIVLHIELNLKDLTTCWPPSQFSSAHIAYTNAVCQNGGKLYPDVPDPVLRLPDDWPSDNEIINDVLNDRKFVPAIIVGQGLLFLLPYIFWSVISASLSNLNTLVREYENSAGGKSVAGQITHLIKHPITAFGGFGAGYLLSLTYALSKFGFWLICLIQMGILGNVFGLNFFLLNRYLRELGMSVAGATGRNVTGATGVVTLANFPKVVLCEFEMRQLSVLHKYTVMCNVDVADTVQGHLYLMWAWLVIVLVFITLSGLSYCAKAFMWCCAGNLHKRRMLEKYLGYNSKFKSSNSEEVDKFARFVLKPDSLFVLEMIERNGSERASYAAMNCLWEEFVGNSGGDEKKAGADEMDDIL